MSLLDDLRTESAAALDRLCDLIPPGVPSLISIVISHPGGPEDAIIVGQHEIAELLAIAVHMETVPVHVGEVDASEYRHERVTTGRQVQ